MRKLVESFSLCDKADRLGCLCYLSWHMACVHRVPCRAPADDDHLQDYLYTLVTEQLDPIVSPNARKEAELVSFRLLC
jgi:hypothetical protein